jgi:hypothetical protein
VGDGVLDARGGGLRRLLCPGWLGSGHKSRHGPPPHGTGHGRPRHRLVRIHQSETIRTLPSLHRPGGGRIRPLSRRGVCGKQGTKEGGDGADHPGHGDGEGGTGHGSTRWSEETQSPSASSSSSSPS